MRGNQKGVPNSRVPVWRGNLTRHLLDLEARCKALLKVFALLGVPCFRRCQSGKSKHLHKTTATRNMRVLTKGCIMHLPWKARFSKAYAKASRVLGGGLLLAHFNFRPCPLATGKQDLGLIQLTREQGTHLKSRIGGSNQFTFFSEGTF